MKHPDDMSNAELIVWQEGRIQELERQLSIYQGGVEVEGNINEYGKFTIAEATACPPNLIGQRVRVLVIPEERIVGSNKTMEVE